ncbi:MAG: GNAT family N-acetyltransferase [Bacteroides sp.]|nr:GNAT family N-acetyltransferase [Bacteroides sp.]
MTPLLSQASPTPNAPTLHISLEDNGREGRFVLTADGVFAGEMTFVRNGSSTLVVDHTGVEAAFEGKGYGGKLLEAVVDYARRHGAVIRPQCSFVERRLSRQPEYADVLER